MSVPPTEDARPGNGEVNQDFLITLAGLLGVTGVEVITAGCHSIGSGTSNCVNVMFQQNTVNGTFNTPWSLATCGENNLNGTAALAQPPNGKCKNNGIGSMVTNIRIGTAQLSWQFATQHGTPYPDCIDPAGGVCDVNAAFTPNIVSNNVVQLVKQPVYTLGIVASGPAGLGQWTSGATFVTCCDSGIGTSRVSMMEGNVGGQSFLIANAGSGQTPGLYTTAGTNCGVSTGGSAPKLDITVGVNGTIIDARPTSIGPAIGISVLGTNAGLPGGTCTFIPNAGGTPGSIVIAVGGPDGFAKIGSYNTDSNEMGDQLYGNEGEPPPAMNPLYPFFKDGNGGVFEPGLPIMNFGEFVAPEVTGLIGTALNLQFQVN
jgi:hypothetical protein